MSAIKPTIVFVPGAWHTPASFDLVKQQLEPMGYPVVGLTLPSVGAEPPNKTADDDAAALKLVLEDLSEKGTDIVVLSHSYGGLVVSNAIEGFGHKQRAGAGKQGGVVMNMFISSFAIPKGLSLVDLLPNNQFLPWMRREGDYVYADVPADIFYHDVSTELRDQAIAALQHQSAPVYETKATYEPWHDIATAFLVCEEDAAIIPVVQEQMVSMLGEQAQVYRVKASHSPFLSVPDKVAQYVNEAAEYGLKHGKSQS